ncbi:hypothetical protein ILUMI_12073 [Ignelater luminosus]|uniref:Synaptic plasticity regulator PANTS n=1 Tax=Ignelater luminosus TaxID=2038154 RepID=A0A8K0CUT9_IGNLU|nr:hypothetical protein ILUMI_12073 [Ignelater luminosus]
MSQNEEDNNNSDPSTDFPDEWMIRPSQTYLDEYKDCRSIAARLHQLFVYGETIDCSQWRRDYDNCRKWQDTKDMQAAKELVKSETNRRLTRLRAHYNNDVWEKRKEPPEDWNKPLPEYLQKEYENTFLNLKSKELKGEPIPAVAETLTSDKCVIL